MLWGMHLDSPTYPNHPACMEPMENETPPAYHVYMDYGIDVASLWGDRCVLANEWWLLRGVT